MKPRTIFFIGKPGCGKGTQAKLLSEKTGWQIISAGQQFRSIAAEDTMVGRKIHDEINAGDLAPHWFAMYLYLKALFAVPPTADVIFDGFNRKVDEARLVIDSLVWLNRDCTVVYLAISDDLARERISGRKDLEGRADDHAVDERLKEYELFTEPAIELFREMPSFLEVDGAQPPEVIAEAINTALGL